MIPADTSSKAAAIQFGLLNALSGGDRLRIAMTMSDFVKRLKLSALRNEHPEIAESELKKSILRSCFKSTEDIPSYLR
jgi:hypothetical protein